MAKKTTATVKYEQARPVEGAGFSLRSFRHTQGRCAACGGELVHAKISKDGKKRMGVVCAGTNESAGCGATFGRNKATRFGSA